MEDKLFELHLTQMEIEAVMAALEYLNDKLSHYSGDDSDAEADNAASNAANKARLLLAYAEAESKRVEAFHEYQRAVYGREELPFE